MAWIPIYADESDIALITEKLNQDPEIAHIVSSGHNRWVARQAVERIDDGDHYLWHIPGGPIKRFKEGRLDVLGKTLRSLLKIKKKMLQEAGWVDDPFAGWKSPWLGSEPNIIELKVCVQGSEFADATGISAFGWIGNRYGTIGSPAARETTNWWRRMRNWVGRNSMAKVPRSGPLDGPDGEIWVLPSAGGKIENGRPRDSNPS